MKKTYLLYLMILIATAGSLYVLGSKSCEKRYHNYYVTQYRNQLDATIETLENLQLLLSKNNYDEKNVQREISLCKIQLELLETSVNYFRIELDSPSFTTMFTRYIIDTQIKLDEVIETQSILESMVQHLIAIREVDIFSNEIHDEENINIKWNSTLSFLKFGDKYELIGR